MEKITPQEFQRLIRSCQVLEKDGHGEKVLRRHDGIIIKIFRRKRFLSSALLFPYAQRFSRNALKLWAFDIPTIRVVKCGHCPNPARDLVWYQPVEGQTLRDYAREQSLEPLMEQLGHLWRHSMTMACCSALYTGGISLFNRMEHSG
ncbi:hypothetical protein [Desulfuromonas acetoxidans]|uniref:hypothetical protein n=1 Tax=Desulfuromonas acetoxidans TaxID=891 RepID=UPI001884260B|nr:hypothetical protein [Desulfuromonas acetoxidans]MBF0645931.1 hypothetical protein [Desulfuromonas acetoxidans]